MNLAVAGRLYGGVQIATRSCTGFANGYMVNTSTEAAITWNDISVNENMHAATAFQLLRQPAHNFLAGLDADDYRFVRRTVIGIVLATDMASHAELLDDFSGAEVLRPLHCTDARSVQSSALLMIYVAPSADMGSRLLSKKLPTLLHSRPTVSVLRNICIWSLLDCH